MKVEDIYADLPTLETERITLRKITAADLADMFEYSSDDEVTAFVTWETHRTIADTKGFLDYILGQYDKKQIAPWGIELKENGKMIGTIDYVDWDTNNKVGEIAYCISKEYWGQGLTTEAARKIIKFGFENMDLVRVQARCYTGNTGSSRVMEKSGMTFEGVIRQSLFAKGKHWDLKMYSVLKEEFKA